MDLIELHDGRVLRAHPADQCIGSWCCIHRPSDHPLRTAPLDWSPQLAVMWRVCEHGVRHPDPDSVTVLPMLRGLAGLLMAEAIDSSHLSQSNCDGCCRPSPRGRPFIAIQCLQGTHVGCSTSGRRECACNCHRAQGHADLLGYRD